MVPGDGVAAAGRLLIASPLLAGADFARSLVLLLDADEHGALGVILNRPSEVFLGGLLDPWETQASPPAVLFSGGPVEPESAIGVAVLSEGAAEPPGWRRMFGDVGVIDLDVPADGFAAVRIYAGYAGWGPGQLESEIAEGAWYVVPAQTGDLAADDAELLWRRVLRRQPDPLSLLLTMPVDPARN